MGEIFDLLQTAPPKGTVNNYDPNYADEFNSQSYGGFMMGPGGKGGRGGGNSGGGGFGGGRSVVGTSVCRTSSDDVAVTYRMVPLYSDVFMLV